MGRLQNPHFLKSLFRQIAIAGAYGLAISLTLHYFPLRNIVAVPDPAAAVAIACLILWGRSNVLGVFVGALVATGLNESSWLVVFSYAFGATLQTLLGYHLFEYYRKKHRLEKQLNSLKQYFFFLIFVGFLSTLIRPLLVSFSLFFSEGLSVELLLHRLVSHWFGDAMGCIIFVPAILGVFGDRQPRLSPKKISQAFVLMSICLFVGQLIFFDWFHQELGGVARPYWMFLFVSWVAIFSGIRVMPFALILIAVQSFWGTILGMGTFSSELVSSGLLSYNFFIFVVCFLGMSISLYAKDQSEQKNTLLSKLKELQLKSQALDAISQGVLICDGQQNIAYVNRAFQEMTGYQSEEVIGKPPLSMLGNNFDEDLIKKIQNGLKNEQSFLGELLSFKKDGSSFWSEVSLSRVENTESESHQFVAVHQDITVRKSIEAQAMLAKAVFEHNLNGIVVSDAEQNILLVNPMLCQMTGYEASELIGKKTNVFASGQHDKMFYSDMWNTINAHRHWAGEIWNCRKNGEIYPSWLSINSVVNDHDEVVNFIGMHTDLSQHKKDEGNIERLANYDTLTGLPNLVLIQKKSEQCLTVARLNQSEFALLFLDLDHFQYINDAIGHKVGDALLVAVAKRFQELLREGDVLARQSGDEFIVLLPGASEKAALHVARKILNACMAPFQVDEHALSITTSIGIALFPQNGQDFNELSKCADTALNFVKQHERNNFKLYVSSMSAKVNDRVLLENALHLAVVNEQFSLRYQALIDLQSGKMNGFEALIRWSHPELGEVSPARFIPIAEECGAIKAIGAWVLNSVCEDIRRWTDAGLVVPQIAINFSPRQFRDPHMILHIRDALDRNSLSASALCMEITEGVLMDDAQASQRTLTELKNLGVTLSLDDFGTGYSSLSYLKLFPFDKVKIDQSFVSGISSDNEDAAIVIAIIAMAHSLGIRVLAEGVETQAQCEFLRNNMSDEIQGYFFSKPIPAAEAEMLMREDRQLPAELLRLNKPEETLLFVDDEPNIVSSLKRLVRKDGYKILTANSGQEGLEILAKNKVDVIISDQRMPGMTGVEFLRNVKEHYPDTIRMVLSGYTELNSVTDAINEGAVFRFLTKPWDDEKLRKHISDAFHYKALADENRLLSLKAHTSNQELAKANRQLAELLQEKQQQLVIDAQSLDIAKEALQYTKIAVLGLDDTNTIVFTNEAALDLFAYLGPIFGRELEEVLPELQTAILTTVEQSDILLKINEQLFEVRWRRMGNSSRSNGKIIIFNLLNVQR